MMGRREIGHLHGDHALHASFPKNLWAKLHEEGRIDYDPVFPGKRGRVLPASVLVFAATALLPRRRWNCVHIERHITF